MDIATSLRQACDEAGWSALQLAAATDKKSSETARAWITGRRMPPGDVILRLILTEPIFRRHLLGEEAA